MRKNLECRQPGCGHVAAGIVHYHGGLGHLLVPVHGPAVHLLLGREEEPVPLLVGLVAVLDDGVRYGLNVS